MALVGTIQLALCEVLLWCVTWYQVIEIIKWMVALTWVHNKHKAVYHLDKKSQLSNYWCHFFLFFNLCTSTYCLWLVRYKILYIFTSFLQVMWPHFVLVLVSRCRPNNFSFSTKCSLLSFKSAALVFLITFPVTKLFCFMFKCYKKKKKKKKLCN